MATQNVIIVVAAQGTVVVQRQLQSIGQSATSAASSVGLLNSALRLIGGALVLRQLTRTADAFVLIQNRIRTVTEGTEELNAVTDELFNVSTRTRTAFEANAELYQRFAGATSRLGLSQGELLRIVESLNQAVTLSGVTSVEAANALRQLSQGIGSSQLRGQELRSVLEQLPVVADVIAERFGVTRGELLKLGQDGKIGAKEVIEAFQNLRGELAERFGETVPTIGQAFTVLGNSFLRFVGELNKSTGIFTKIAETILSLAGNFENIGRAAIVLSSILVTVLVGRGFTAVIAGVKALTIAIAANPFGAIAVAITAGVTALITFGDRIKVSSDGLANFRDLAQATFEFLKEAFQGLVQFIKDNFEPLAEFFEAAFGDIEFSIAGLLRFIAKTLDGTIGLFEGTAKAIVVIFENIGPGLKQAFVAIFNAILKDAEKFLNGLVDVLVPFKELLGQPLPKVELPRLELAEDATDVGALVGEAFKAGILRTNVQDALEGVLDRAEQLAKERIAREAAGAGADLEKAGALAGTAGGLRGLELAEILDDLAKQAEILQLTNFERQVQNDLLKIEEQLRNKNIVLTETERGQVETALRRVEASKVQAEILDDLVGAQEQLNLGTEALNNLLEQGIITIDQYNAKLRELQLASLETDRSFESGIERGLLRIQDNITDVASVTENLLVNAFNAAEEALVQFVQTGELDIKSFVESVLADLTKLLLRLALIELFKGGAGGVGLGLLGLGAIGGAGALAGGAGGGLGDILGLQQGGPAPAGRPRLVGEAGPEIFVPTGSGTVVPMAPQAPPQVNVQVVNVTDPNEISSALNTSQGENAIINVIRRHRRSIRTVLG